MLETLLNAQKFDTTHKTTFFAASATHRCIPLQTALSGIVLKAVH